MKATQNYSEKYEYKEPEKQIKRVDSSFFLAILLRVWGNEELGQGRIDF